MTAAVGWTGGRAVGNCLTATLLLTAGPPDRLSAQLVVLPSLGVRYTSTLVHDAIVTPLSVRPALAPTLAVTVTTPLEHGWAGQAMLDFSTSALERHDADGATADLGRLSTLAFTAGVRRAVAAGLTAAAGAGGINYFPADETGIFRQGSGSIAGLGAVSVEYAPTMARRHGLAMQARYDVHRFITPALKSEGFDAPRTVHRVALAIRVALGTAQ
jgi:hypothetical protein